MSIEWQSIETAPKDGARIIVFTNGSYYHGKHDKDEPEVMEAYWFEGWYNDNTKSGWMPANCDEEYGALYEATHWMPLPKPPVTETKE